MTVLHAEQATIHTATVTIKTLTVDGRQVSQALFRQLPETLLLYNDETDRIYGHPWGTVNYCPDKKVCGGSQPYAVVHRHVVWEWRGGLYRATVASAERHYSYRTYSGERLPEHAWQQVLELPQLFIAT